MDFDQGALVPSLILAQCPADRVMQGVSCERGRSSCPTGSTCQGTRCCWDETEAVAAPCDDPMMQGTDFVTCDVPGQSQGQGQGQGQGRTCPGQCHTCRDLTGVGMGLCCPNTRQRGCESASPAQVAFERAAQRMRGGTGSGSSSTGGTGTSTTTSGRGFQQQSSLQSDLNSGQGTFRDTRGIAPGDTGGFAQRDTRGFAPRDTRGFAPRDTRGFDTSMDRFPIRDPRDMPARREPTRPTGPCGVGIRPVSTCRRIPFMPSCPRGFYCVQMGFMGACCPVGTGPVRRDGFARGMGSVSRDGFDRRMGRSRFPGQFDRFSPSRPRTDTFRSDRTRLGSSGRLTDGSGQLRGRSDRGSTSVNSSGGGASAIGAGSTAADLDAMLFGPLPDETFRGGPIDTANTPRGECPRTITCRTDGYNECYSDSQCQRPLRCCLRPGCRNTCA